MSRRDTTRLRRAVRPTSGIIDNRLLASMR
jgi:hypothetical protein